MVRGPPPPSLSLAKYWHVLALAKINIAQVTQVITRIQTVLRFDMYLLPQLDEKVAALHLPSLGANLTKLSKEQVDYIGVKVDGPFKQDTYRY